ncbi:hypothetical protein [Sphingomonas sp. 3-13AW]|uniref:DUF7831 domain-containing protein n=1 Tax=Sphingomonas sp. 3-13AW TaxID=3050450 RepID=UPI003BB789F0
MPIVTVERYTRSEIRAHREHLYVFGDNLARAGGAPDANGWSNPKAGQAAACRNEPNAVGIPTKRAPSMKEDAFFTDADFDRVQPIIQAEFRRLADHLRAGGTVVLPSAGIGTDRAQLAQRSPRIREFIDRCFAHLRGIEAQSPGEPAPTAKPIGVRRQVR